MKNMDDKKVFTIKTDRKKRDKAKGLETSALTQEVYKILQEDAEKDFKGTISKIREFEKKNYKKGLG